MRNVLSPREHWNKQACVESNPRILRDLSRWSESRFGAKDWPQDGLMKKSSRMYGVTRTSVTPCDDLLPAQDSIHLSASFLLRPQERTQIQSRMPRLASADKASLHAAPVRVKGFTHGTSFTNDFCVSGATSVS